MNEKRALLLLFLGSAGCQPAGFGSLPKRTFSETRHCSQVAGAGEVRDGWQPSPAGWQPALPQTLTRGNQK